MRITILKNSSYFDILTLTLQLLKIINLLLHSQKLQITLKFFKIVNWPPALAGNHISPSFNPPDCTIV